MEDNVQNIHCDSCGADLRFAPGVQSLECPYCGNQVDIAASDQVIEELDFRSFLETAEAQSESLEVITVTCRTCNAETTLDDNVTASLCPFCGTALVAQAHSKKIIQPQSILPFSIDQRRADHLLKSWINGLWFAPTKLKKYARRHGLDGVYTPYWTYDCASTGRYRGQRGEHYYVNVPYTTTNAQGKVVSGTRRVQKTRWYPAAGTVRNHFDDVVVVASHSLPKHYVDALTPWDLENLVPFDKAYLTGFRVESYGVGLQEGFVDAQQKMEPTIRRTVERDIGGDVQRIQSLDVDYADITFKHTLLPLWICAYRFRNEAFRVLINARTGEVQGERPWSWAKIVFTVLAILLVILVLLLVFDQ